MARSSEFAPAPVAFGLARLSRQRRTRPKVALPPGCDPDSIVLTFPVAAEHAGLRLDRFIQNRIPRLSRTKAQAIVRSCAFAHDGRRRRVSERVRFGEIVMLVRPYFKEPDAPTNFGVVYEDDAIIGIDKPALLPVHPSATYHKNTLTYAMRQRWGDDAPHIAHRLDRETSGLVICAKHIEAERALKRAFEERRVQKRYIAIVQGQLENNSGLIDLPIARPEQGLHILMEVKAAGQGSPSVTRYEVLERKEEATLVSLSPKTGRQHQLRVHMGAIGHPIVGDKLYGPEGVQPFMEYIDQGMTPALQRRLGHDRQALHALDLEFEHPMSGQKQKVRAPFSADLRALWEAMGPRLNDGPSALESLS